MSAPTLARWGTPPGPVALSGAARRFLSERLGPGGSIPAPESWNASAPPSRLTPGQRALLEAAAGAPAVGVSDLDRLLHARGCSLLDLLAVRAGEPGGVPDAVVRPGDAAAVQQVLSVCSAEGIAVVPFGGGTSVVGGVNGGSIPGSWISISAERMDRVVEIDEVSQTVTVEPGITGPALERILAARGLTLGHFPQSWERATIGGYAATRSAGQASSGYGRSDEMIEGVWVATPSGTLRFGRAPKSAAGPDLLQVFVGSEGALGIITDVTLRIRRKPAALRYEGIMFPSWERGAAALRELAQLRATADVMRLSDRSETAATLAMSGPAGTARAVLDRYLGARGVGGGCLGIFGWEGSSRRDARSRRARSWQVLRRHGAVSLGASVGSSWRRHRYDGPYLRDELLDAGYLVETVETAAHWRRVPQVYRRVGAALSRGLAVDGRRAYVMCHVSHVYETGASLYFTAIVAAGADPQGQWLVAKRAATDAMADAGATITHHHAVGRDHQPWLDDEIGPGGVAILTAVKAAVDPKGVMNPGVLVPAASAQAGTGQARPTQPESFPG